MQMTPAHVHPRLEELDVAEARKLRPRKVPLLGIEGSPFARITTNIPEKDKVAHTLEIHYADRNPEGISIKKEETAKRSTVLVPILDDNDENTSAFVFTGFISVNDARLWYLRKFGYPDNFDNPSSDAKA